MGESGIRGYLNYRGLGFRVISGSYYLGVCTKRSLILQIPVYSPMASEPYVECTHLRRLLLQVPKHSPPICEAARAA